MFIRFFGIVAIAVISVSSVSCPNAIAPDQASPTPEASPEVTSEASAEPSGVPTDVPTLDPTAAPTDEPTQDPTVDPTEEPTQDPTPAPTDAPTQDPTAAPTDVPTMEPTPTTYPAWSWIYPGGSDWCRDAVMTSEGNILTAGDSTLLGGGANYNDFWLVTLDIAGSPLSDKSFGGSGYEMLGGIAKTEDDGFVVVGTTKTYGRDSGDNSHQDGWVIKLDSALAIEWSRAYGKENKNEMFNKAVVLSDGYLFAGYTENDGTGNREAWLVRCDTQGAITWQKSYGFVDSYSQKEARSAIEVSDGYIVTGIEWGSGDLGHAIIFKVAKSDGAIIWQKYYYYFSSAEAGAANDIVSADGGANAVVAATDGFDIWVLKIKSSDGTLSWSGAKTISPGNFVVSFSITVADDGGYVIAGRSTKSASPQDDDGVIFKISSAGLLVWKYLYSTAQDDTIYSIINNGSGGFAACGTTGDSLYNNPQYWVLNIDSLGNCGSLDTDPGSTLGSLSINVANTTLATTDTAGTAGATDVSEASITVTSGHL